MTKSKIPLTAGKLFILVVAVLLLDSIPAFAQTTQTNPDSIPFAPAVNYPVGHIPRILFCADLDNDGDFDIAVTNEYSDNLSILRNNGDGTFQPSTYYPCPSNPEGIFCADLDRDGYLDLAVANWPSDYVSILINEGDGTFDLPIQHYNAGDGPTGVFCADLDGDLDLDLAVTNAHNGRVSILKNDGNGTFPTRTDYGVGVSPYWLSGADLDGDGDCDLAVPNVENDNVSVLFNNSDGTFQTAVNYPTGDRAVSVFCADLDGDIDQDMVVSNWWGDSVTVLLNNGDGEFLVVANYPTGDGPHNPFCADLDGDSDLDIVLANHYTNTISILKNNGYGTYRPKIDYIVGANPYSVFCADLDGDGDYDLAVANSGSDSVAILKNLSNDSSCYFTNGEYFDIDLHAWGFDNDSAQLWPEGGVFPSWSNYCQAFNILIPSPTQMLYYGLLVLIHKGRWGGSCYGMAYTCQLLKDGFQRLQDFEWTDEIYPINVTDISGNPGARDHMNKYYLYQFGAVQTAFKWVSLREYSLVGGPRQVIPDLRLSFGTQISGAISFWWKQPNDSMTVGHTVTPICMYRVSVSPEIYRIWVYDNNDHADKNQFFTINTTANTWTYSALGPSDQPKEIYLDVPTFLQVVPLVVPQERTNDPRSNFFSPLTDSGLCLVSNGGSEEILIVSGSDSLGFMNNELIDRFEEGAPLFMSGGVSGYAYPYAYVFPRNNTVTHLGVDSAGNCNFFLIDSLFHARISLDGEDTAGSYLVDYDTASSGFCIASNSVSSRVLTLTVIDVEDTCERMFKCSDYQINYSETLSVAFSDIDSNAVRDVVMKNVGTNKRITIEAEFFDGDSSMFRARFVNIDSNSIYHFFPNWDSVSQSDMIVWIDHGGNGSIDDSIVVENEYGVIRGDANGDKVINASDVVYLINYLFISGPAPVPLAAGDCNCDGNVNASDVVYLINYLFISGPPPGC